MVAPALSAALPTADALAQPFIVARLLKKGVSAEYQTGLIHHWHQFSAKEQREILLHLDALAAAVRLAGRQKSPQTAWNLLEILDRSKSASLAYIAGELSRHREPAIRRQAGLILQSMVEHGLGKSTRNHGRAATATNRPYGKDSFKLLRETVEHYSLAVEQPEQGLLIALLRLMPGSAPAVIRFAKQSKPSGLTDFAELLSDSDHPAVIPALLSMLAVPALAKAAAKGLARRFTNHDHTAILGQGHLLTDPTISKRIHQLPGKEKLAPVDEALREADADSGRDFAILLLTISMDDTQRLRKLAILGQSDHEQARLSAARAIICLLQQREIFAGPDVLAGFLFDESESIARIALRQLLIMQWEGLDRLLPDLVNSNHESIGRLAAHRLAPVAFDRLWKRWPKLTAQQRLASGRALIKIDVHFHEQLRRKMVSRDGRDITRAIAMIDQLGQAEFFRETLLHFCDHADNRIVASAVRALGPMEGGDVRMKLEMALDHSNARVRANAVEALDQQDGDRHLRQLVAMAAGDENRPRANAIKSLMAHRAADALRALASMLNDSRPRHRISALWVAGELGLLQLAELIADISANDNDPAVRDKAGQALTGMINLIQPTGDLETASSARSFASTTRQPVSKASPQAAGVQA